VLRRTSPGPQRLRIRGFTHAAQWKKGQPEVEVTVNQALITRRSLDRPGLFIIECDLPDAPEYQIEIASTPTFTIPDDDRTFSINLSMIKLTPGKNSEARSQKSE
jgi:hypothetical protein